VTNVAIVGAAGRMGQIMATGLSLEPDLTLVALVDARQPAEDLGAPWFTSLDQAPSGLEVVVDFSTTETARATIEWCLDQGVAGVIGTSGFTEAELIALRGRVDAASGHVLVAANFSIGAVLAERFAAIAAPYFDRVEIIELHHDQKVDAPSGTSMATARRIVAARREAGITPLEEPTQVETLAHARGADADDGVRIHAVRLPGLVAHQEVILGRPGEGLTIRHDSYDRTSFVSGVALAVRAVRDRAGLTLGIDQLV
jgi:4-hydroxy-tetrahydrodipicolinate reductase